MEYEPAKIIVKPNGALFIGGPLDGRLEEFEDFKPAIYSCERNSPLLAILDAGTLHWREATVQEVCYRLERFAVDSDGERGVRTRFWAIYIDTRLSLEEAFSKLFLSYALGASRNACVEAIEAVR